MNILQSRILDLQMEQRILVDNMISFIVRNGCYTAKVVMPGEFVEIYADELKCFEGEVAVELHMESPFQETGQLHQLLELYKDCLNTQS